MSLFIILPPLINAIFIGLLCKKLSHTVAGIISCVMLIISAIAAIIIFRDVAILKAPSIYINFFSWFDVANIQLNWGMNFDVVSTSMLAMICLISALIHIYSTGYMCDDENLPRFMSYLSLFTFFMIILVSAGNFLQLFVGWEGVGLCSYLLIGFWYQKESANKAAMKAFIVNRVGDVGYILAMINVYYLFDSLEFSQVFQNISDKTSITINFLGLQCNGINLICIFLFLGSMGKSAQIFLHTWLPDAMEGPTPVSALIHAATMVTAGVFLVVRCSPLFIYADYANNLMMIVGSVTCAFAAFVALSQNDIKKIIAYSTCSQLGYMFFACGAGAYDAGLFHLLTHAFFKALLFLGAGAIIHALSGIQDINKMGGLMHKLPFSYVSMWIGSLSLAGIYPFSGYFSKDLILEAAYANGSNIALFAFALGLLGALATAFYSWRLIIKCFHGKANAEKEVMLNVHEAPYTMMVPLLFLATGAIYLVGMAIIFYMFQRVIFGNKLLF